MPNRWKIWVWSWLISCYAKQSVANLLISRQQYKVKLILSRMMEKVDLKRAVVIAKVAAFHSATQVNLESTNSNNLFSKMNEPILESFAKFQWQGINWRFRSVLSLDRHTVKYEPLGGSYYIPLPDFLAEKRAIIHPKITINSVSIVLLHEH